MPKIMTLENDGTKMLPTIKYEQCVYDVIICLGFIENIRPLL